MATQQIPDSNTLLEKIQTLEDQKDKTIYKKLAEDIQKKVRDLQLQKMSFNESEGKTLYEEVTKVQDLSMTNTGMGQMIARAGQRMGISRSDSAGGKFQESYRKIRDILENYCSSQVSKRIAKILEEFQLDEGEVLSFGQLLTEKQSLNLFIEKVQGSDQPISGQPGQPSMNQKLEEIGKEIVKKCEGVPLVVKKVAKGLSHNRDHSDWEFVRDNFTACLEVLFYDKYLPEHLKPCFSYCCLFPEDHQIDVLDLITMWVAADLIDLTKASSAGALEHTSGRTDTNVEKQSADPTKLEEIARQYFKELHGKGFLVDLPNDVMAGTTTHSVCKMHSLIRQLGIHIAWKHSVLPHILVSGNVEEDLAITIPQGVRHVSFTLGPEAVLSSYLSISSSNITQMLKGLTTLLIFATADSTSNASADMSGKRWSECEDIISSCNSTLRVLGINNIGMNLKALPSSITKCPNLVFLDLSKNNIDKLPDGITKMSMLQELKLSNCLLLKELPKDIGTLSKNLRHLIIDGCDALTSMPQDLGKLTELRTLSRFLVRDRRQKSDGRKSNNPKPLDAPSPVKQKQKQKQKSKSKGRSESITKTDIIGPSDSFNENPDPTVPDSLKELGALKKLRGELEIFHLDRLNYSTAEQEAKQAELDKKDLEGLTLKWHGPKEQGVAVPNSRNKDILEGLKPRPNLKRLFLSGYDGGEFPSWFNSPPTLNNLVRLTLFNCSNCEFLPPLDGFNSLKSLELLRLRALKFIAEKDPSPGPSIYSTLKELNLSLCPSLKAWTKTRTSIPPSFPSLSKLQIQYCPLTDMPLFPNLVDQLILVSASLEPLRQTIEMKPESEDKARPLSKLKHMYIEKAVGENWSTDLFSKQDIDHSQSLSSLEYLKIKDSQLFDLFKADHNKPWEGLRRLRSLTLWGISDLNSLPQGLLQVTTLEYLRVFKCPSLVKLPEPMNKLTSLKRLVISKCENMCSLPNGLQELKDSLNSLVIEDCPKLLARCRKDTGEDWPKIKDIPNFSLKSTAQDLE